MPLGKAGILLFSVVGKSPHGVVADVLDIVSKHNFSYTIKFTSRLIPSGKVWIFLSLHLWVKSYHYSLFDTCCWLSGLVPHLSTRLSPPLRTPVEPTSGRNAAGRKIKGALAAIPDPTRPLTAVTATGLAYPASALSAISMPAVDMDSFVRKV